MRSFLVVAGEPLVADLPDLIEILEQVRIEDFLAVAPIEAFDEGVLIRFAWLDEPQINQVFFAPERELASDELWHIVDPDRLRQPTPFLQLRQDRKSTRLNSSHPTI